MSTRGMAAAAAALVLLVGCGGTSDPEPEAGSEQVTERGPVSADGVLLTGPNELDVTISSCMGDPVAVEVEERDEQVGIRIVTTMVVSGDVAACQDVVQVTLQEPLDGRTVIDLVSGETLTVVELSTLTPNSLAGLCEDMDVDWVEGEPGHETVEEAIEAFVAYESGLLEDATFEGEEVLYEGEVVGQVSVDRMPAGGYRVTRAEWCYPDGY